MNSNDPADWEQGWDEFLSKVHERHPDFRPAEVEAFRRKAETATKNRREERNARLAGSMSEAQWFYEKGKRLKQEGKLGQAEEVWRWLIEAFGAIEAESPWVERAKSELAGDPVNPARSGAERWAPVRKALEEAKRLEQEGKLEEAKRIREALRALYADDPSARAILKE